MFERERRTHTLTHTETHKHTHTRARAHTHTHVRTHMHARKHIDARECVTKTYMFHGYAVLIMRLSSNIIKPEFPECAHTYREIFPPIQLITL